jgi:hypothetical protein
MHCSSQRNGDGEVAESEPGSKGHDGAAVIECVVSRKLGDSEVQFDCG